MPNDRSSELLAAFDKTSVLRGRELTARGFSRALVADAVARGIVQRRGRGLYTAAHAELSENRSYVEVAQRVPNAVFCLLTACRIHELTTQNPHEVWFALGSKAWTPKVDFVKTRIVRFSGRALTDGIKKHEAEGVSLKVYSVAKTVADLFKYRQKFGLDIALEAMRDAIKQRKCTIDDLVHFARMRGVLKVLEPHLMAYLAL